MPLNRIQDYIRNQDLNHYYDQAYPPRGTKAKSGLKHPVQSDVAEKQRNANAQTNLGTGKRKAKKHLEGINDYIEKGRQVFKGPKSPALERKVQGRSMIGGTSNFANVFENLQNYSKNLARAENALLLSNNPLGHPRDRI